MHTAPNITVKQCKRYMYCNVDLLTTGSCFVFYTGPQNVTLLFITQNLSDRYMIINCYLPDNIAGKINLSFEI